MCGIAGFLDPRRSLPSAAHRAIVKAMADRLAHRGPDQAAEWSDPESGIALGFRRLAILDLSSAAAQPMTSACGRFVMVFNGEIYNFRALRMVLEQSGVSGWRGHGDGEVLLATIAQWGFAAALEQLNGMFALAVWDKKERRLYLARDRFGEKPLYFGTAGGVFLFGSELKALSRHPTWTGEIDRDALGLYLRHDYIPTPWSSYRGITKLLPGHWVSISDHGEVGRPMPYWSARERAEAAASRPFSGDFAEATAALSALVDEAVSMRLEADVPLGAFLSGGIDSSTVVAAMERARPGGTRSFTVGFPGTRFDEAPQAAAVAAHLGTHHETLTVGANDYREVVAALPDVYDEPFADASQIPTILLCRLTREHVTVSLSGDGGDEFFCGYTRYAAARQAWSKVAQLPRLLSGVAGSLASGLAGWETRPIRRLRKLAGNWRHTTPESLYRDRMTRWRNEEGLASDLEERPTAFDVAPPVGLPSLEQRFMWLDAATYLPDDLLVKMDRASMAVGLEVRAPLLDHRIAEFVWSLPAELAVGSGPKWLLRDVLARRLPRALFERPKQGFEAPIGDWLRDGLRDWADDLLAPSRLRQHGLVAPKVVTNRWSEHRSGKRSWTYPLWNVLMLEAWLEQHAAAANAPKTAEVIG
jgi:asparagine synthase (glutamine-hydrolysing)